MTDKTLNDIIVSAEDINNMDYENLRDLKLEWLTYAHKHRIVRKVIGVTKTFGTPVNLPYREYYNLYEYMIGNLILWGADYEGGIYVPSLRRGHRYTFAIGFVDKRWGEVFMDLAYEEGYADFPVKESLNLNTNNNRIFIPGEWVNVLDQKYEEAQKIIAAQSIEEKKIKTATLAKQLLVSPIIQSANNLIQQLT